MLKFVFFDEDGSDVNEELFFALFKSAKRIMAKRIKELLGESEWRIDLILLGDKRIHELNKKYRGKDCATDVLSFTYRESPVWGEIFISVDTAKKQAKEKGHSLEKELGILFVHGFLHLLDFDHNTDNEEEEMEGWARKISGH